MLAKLPPVAMRAVGSIRNCCLDINVHMGLAAVGAVAVGNYVLGAAVIVLFSLSDYLEQRATASVRNSISEAEVAPLREELGKVIN